MKKITWFCLLMYLLISSGCTLSASNTNGPISTGQPAAEPYFGQPFPTSKVTRFSPEIFTAELHSSPIFSPDGKEVYWSYMEQSQGINFMKIEDGVWTEPALAAFERSSKSDSPFLTPDGNTMFFMSGDNSGIERIWQVDKEGGEWGSPRKLAEEVNQYGAHWQASMAANGNLYFSSKGEIFCSKFIDGNYLNAQKLDLLINTENAYEGSPFIAADGSYLIFDRAENYSDADLYITFKNSEGSWDEPVEMKVLNTGAHDLYANVSPDGRFIMFLSGRLGGILLPYWVDAGLIEELRTSDGQRRLGQ